MPVTFDAPLWQPRLLDPRAAASDQHGGQSSAPYDGHGPRAAPQAGSGRGQACGHGLVQPHPTRLPSSAREATAVGEVETPSDGLLVDRLEACVEGQPPLHSGGPTTGFCVRPGRGGEPPILSPEVGSICRTKGQRALTKHGPCVLRKADEGIKHRTSGTSNGFWCTRR